jgi:integrase
MSCLNKSGRHRTIQFVGADGRRRSIRLGKISEQDAVGIKLHVDRLIQSKFGNMPVPGDTASWLGGINEVLYDRLVRGGLCQPRAIDMRGQKRLGEMLDEYIARRNDLKDGSIKMLKQSRDKLVEYFGADKLIGSITAADAADFKRTRLKTDAAGYVSKQIQLSRQFFKDAVEREILDKSPFSKIKPGSQKNPARMRFIARETIDQAINHASDLDWKLIIAFARYGGLRIPTEILALRWSDIDWNTNRIRITASKTEHHVGHGERDIPLFPELRPLLLEAKKKAGSSTIYVINRYRTTSVNLRTQFLRILKSAGIEPWPKLFQNLRSTRQTELAEIFPSHVVCAWLGNSEKIAMGHYLQVTANHFEKAAGVGKNDLNPDDKGNKKGGTGGAESGAVGSSFGSQHVAPSSPPLAASSSEATACDNIQAVAKMCKNVVMGAGGFEPPKAYANGFTARPFWPLRYTPV